MDPTPLMPGAGKDLLDCFPEAERPVADREVRGDLEPALLDVDEELTPALRALAHPVWKPTSSFFPSGVAPISTPHRTQRLAESEARVAQNARGSCRLSAHRGAPRMPLPTRSMKRAATSQPMAGASGNTGLVMAASP
jgi:hypothetical protein